MPRDFSYPSHRLRELIEAPKCLRQGTRLRWENRGGKSRSGRVMLDLLDGPFVDFELEVNAGRVDDPLTYRAALLLGGYGVRGVDFNPVERKKFYKLHIPQGWHQNVIDPNLSTSDPHQNRHISLAGFQPTDLEDFFHNVCRLWHIELPEEGGLF